MARRTGGGSVKAVLPPAFRKEAVYAVLRQEMEKYAPFMIKDFEKVVQYWKGDKPRFVKAMIVRKDYIAIQIRVTGSEEARNKWIWLNEGTRPHKIRAKNAKRLQFRTGGAAGSKPKSKFTIPATPADGAFVSKQEVNHPGFPAREWSLIILKEHEKPFQRWMEAAMRKAAQASGHAIK